MSDKLLLAIANSPDVAWLEGCRDHNRKLGNKEVVQAAELRLRNLHLQNALKIKPEAHSVEERVLESVRVYRELLMLTFSHDLFEQCEMRVDMFNKLILFRHSSRNAAP